jgi:hypothetical protein
MACFQITKIVFVFLGFLWYLNPTQEQAALRLETKSDDDGRQPDERKVA